MNTEKSITKTTSLTSIDEYINTISNKCEQIMTTTKKQLKIGKLSKTNDDDIIVPNINNYYDINNSNYNLKNLRCFAKLYKLKVSGNKKELTTRIFTYLHLSSYIIKIQSRFRGHLLRKYLKCHGPALLNRDACSNNSDFVTMDDLNTIPYNQFFSYKDNDGFIYGFDITSLYNLFIQSDKKLQLKDKQQIKNPYNRNNIPDNILRDIKSIIRLSRALKINIKLDIEDDTISLPTQKQIELRALKLFQNIDALGNYSNPQWFLALDKSLLLKFMRELIDIWNYRAQLSLEVKRKICPPLGMPFKTMNVEYFLTNIVDINYVRNLILDSLEKLAYSGIDNDSRSLGCYYILGALTLVNIDAANALPWLYQSICYY